MKKTRDKADTDLVRQQNRSLVLEALRKHGTLASIELGEKTGLSPATISAITNDMVSERLIETDKEETAKTRNAQRGRPMVKLRLAAEAALILGIHLTHNEISFLTTNFCGGVKTRHTVTKEMSDLSASALSKTLVEEVRRFLSDGDIEASHLSLISVACQGSVDAIKGELIWSPAFSARDIQIAAPLTEAFETACVVANDTNVIAHLLHVEDEENLESFAVLYLGSGIGLGLHVNGALLEGSDGSASEFGHMLWKRDGALCRCGRRGCIEAYASDFGIYRAANKKLENTPPKDISPSSQDMAALMKAARGGDQIAKEAFEQAGHAIGDGLSNLVMLMNPRKIMFTGPGTAHFDLMEKAIVKSMSHAVREENRLELTILKDKRDLIEAGLLALAFTKLDREIFARRVSVADVVARHARIQA